MRPLLVVAVMVATATTEIHLISAEGAENLEQITSLAVDYNATNCNFFDATSCAKAVEGYALNESDNLYYYENVPCWKRSKCILPGTGTFHFDRLAPEQPIPDHVNVQPCVGVLDGYWFVRNHAKVVMEEKISHSRVGKFSLSTIYLVAQ
eukprot:gene24822-10472_t